MFICVEPTLFQPRKGLFQESFIKMKGTFWPKIYKIEINFQIVQMFQLSYSEKEVTVLCTYLI